MKKLFLGVCWIVFGGSIALISSYAFAEEIRFDNNGNVIQSVPGIKNGGGAINWSGKVVSAYGFGAAHPDKFKNDPGLRKNNALVAAQVVAKRNLLSIVDGVSINSKTLVKDTYVEGDLIYQKLKGFLGQPIMSDPIFLPDGTVKIYASKNLSGRLVDVIKSAPIMSGPTHDPSNFNASPKSIPTKVKYTGVIIDDNGKNVHPALIPRILSENNDEIFGPNTSNRSTCIKAGYADYVSSIEEARIRKKAGNNPLRISAENVFGDPIPSDLVVSKDNALKLYAANLDNGILSDCKLVIMLSKN